MSCAHTFDQIRTRPVTVFGAGTLGRRIALMFASRGATVRISDPDTGQVAAAIEYVTHTLPEVLHERGSETAGHAESATSITQALGDCWLVVEAVPERLDIKVPLWGQIDEAAPADTWTACSESTRTCRSGPSR